MQQRNEFFHVVERQLQRAPRESFAQLMAHGRYWSLRHLCSSSAHQCRCVCVVGGFGRALSCWGNGCHCLIFAKVVDFTCRPLCVIIRSGQDMHFYASRAEREANHAWETGCLVLDDDEKLFITDIQNMLKSPLRAAIPLLPAFLLPPWACDVGALPGLPLASVSSLLQQDSV